MKAWQRLLETVTDHGEIREDRTGVGTQSIFGLSAEFINTPDSFPAVTTKRLAVKQCFGEFASFLQGAETLDQFHANGCNFWDGNSNAEHWKKRARFDGDLGPLYGSLWRRWPVPTVREQPMPKLREGLAATLWGVANGKGSSGHCLEATWHSMIQRCYSPTATKYALYGGRGVFVANEWLEFEVFAKDVITLPGWQAKTSNWDGYQLDKDTIGDGFRYGPHHCAWVSLEDNSPHKDKVRYTVERVVDGEVFTFTNPHQFCTTYGLEGRGFCDLWTEAGAAKNAKIRQGFRLVNKQALQLPYIDQLAQLVEGLRKDPYSRRHIMTTWSPSELDRQCLPPCHLLLQAYVSGDQLDFLVYMRSVDLVLGLPADVAGYALLQHLVAREVNMKPRRLLFNFGDAHIYRNHTEAVATILARPPKAPPRLILAPEARLFDFHPSMATLEGYESHEAVKAVLNV